MDLSRRAGAAGPRPASLPLIREATRAGLSARGFEPVEDPAEADLCLVDVVDDGRWEEPCPLPEDLPGCLVVRVHAGDPDGAPAPGFEALLARADRVLVSTRSHLVRLGSAGLLDADRTDLIAPPGPIALTPAGGEPARRVLVLGEQLPAAAERALLDLGLDAALVGADVPDEGAARRLQALAEDHAAVLLTGSEGAEDGVVATACSRLGRPLVAAGGVDLAARPNAFPVAADADASEWAAALHGAMTAGPSTLAAPSAASSAEQAGADEARLDRLARVLSRLGPSADCGHPAAA